MTPKLVRLYKEQGEREKENPNNTGQWMQQVCGKGQKTSKNAWVDNGQATRPQGVFILVVGKDYGVWTSLCLLIFHLLSWTLSTVEAGGYNWYYHKLQVVGLFTNINYLIYCLAGQSHDIPYYPTQQYGIFNVLLGVPNPVFSQIIYRGPHSNMVYLIFD